MHACFNGSFFNKRTIDIAVECEEINILIPTLQRITCIDLDISTSWRDELNWLQMINI